MSTPSTPYDESAGPTEDRPAVGSPGADAGKADLGEVVPSEGSPGNAADVPVPSDVPSPGTSEASPPVPGTYVPEIDESIAIRR